MKCNTVLPPLVIWMAWIWDLMVSFNARMIISTWTTSPLILNVIRCFMLEIWFVPMKIVHTISNTWFKTKRYWKGHIAKPLFNFIVPNEMYTCIFCNSLSFFQFRCGARIFIIIGHMSSPRYNHFIVHVDLHNHLNAKERNERFWIRWTNL